MKKKMFFIAGLAVSAIAASCFIPLADGNYWWSAWNEPHVTVVDFPDRFPAGTNQGTPIDPSGQDPTLPDEYPVEPQPDYTGGSDKNPTQPSYPNPAPQPQAPATSCIERAFVADPNSNCTGCVKGVSFSSQYINSYLNAAAQSPYRLRRGSQKRLAILGILTAGYCSFKSKYQHEYPSSTILPDLKGNWQSHSLQERTKSWRRNNRRNVLFCNNDSFEEIRIRACETVYRRCNLGQYVDADCRGVEDDRGKDDDDKGGGSHNGGSTTGSTTGEREVGEGTNQGAGHGADQGGGHGERPSGVSH